MQLGWISLPQTITYEIITHTLTSCMKRTRPYSHPPSWARCSGILLMSTECFKHCQQHFRGCLQFQYTVICRRTESGRVVWSVADAGPSLTHGSWPTTWALYHTCVFILFFLTFLIFNYDLIFDLTREITFLTLTPTYNFIPSSAIAGNSVPNLESARKRNEHTDKLALCTVSFYQIDYYYWNHVGFSHYQWYRTFPVGILMFI